MSLLMEALKKAEEAKRRAGGASAAPEPLLEPLEPPPAPPPAGPLPNLSQHLDAIDAELADLPQTPPPRRSAPRAAPEPPPAAARAPRRRTDGRRPRGSAGLGRVNKIVLLIR